MTHFRAAALLFLKHTNTIKSTQTVVVFLYYTHRRNNNSVTGTITLSWTEKTIFVSQFFLNLTRHSLKNSDRYRKNKTKIQIIFYLRM